MPCDCLTKTKLSLRRWSLSTWMTEMLREIVRRITITPDYGLRSDEKCDNDNDDDTRVYWRPKTAPNCGQQGV